MRLDRYLSEMGVESRSRIRELCKRGKVRVNGAVQKKSDFAVTPGVDEVTVEGQRIEYQVFVYYMLNKPAGVVSAVTDAREKTVIDLIPGRKRKDLFPVGRWDKDTEGLLLITNDGELANRLLSPKHHVPKTYFARVRGPLEKEIRERLTEGVDIGEERRTLPAVLAVQKEGEISEVTLTITEGRYHQVKRMFLAVGSEILYLKRLSMGSLTLDPALEPGEVRPLTAQEIRALVSSCLPEKNLI